MRRLVGIVVAILFGVFMLYLLGSIFGGGVFMGFLAIIGFLLSLWIYHLLSGERSVKENARLGKILKKLWSIGHDLKIKDEDAESDKRHYSSDQLDQIELWIELIQKKLMP